MPNAGRRLRGVQGERAIRAFERIGYRIARTRGSHVILEHPERKALVIPRHGALRPGLLLARVKDAGLTPEEFADLL